VSYMCDFNCPSFPDSLAIASGNSLTIGSIEEIQKLHIQSVPIGETPRRLVWNAHNARNAVPPKLVSLHLAPHTSHLVVLTRVQDTTSTSTEGILSHHNKGGGRYDWRGEGIPLGQVDQRPDLRRYLPGKI
jgi:DNA damage-binding protein 1